jgi:hypothetical protein
MSVLLHRLAEVAVSYGQLEDRASYGGSLNLTSRLV